MNDLEPKTTEKESLKGRVEKLEEILERIDCYLDNHTGIRRGSQCHLQIKLMLGKVQWGDRVFLKAVFEEKI